jgi:hypothetical protein
MLDTPLELMNPDEGGMLSFISNSPINGGYISPYQPVIDEEVSLSVSSSLSGSPLGEDYINPYQPIIQNESVHEYISIYVGSWLVNMFTNWFHVHVSFTFSLLNASIAILNL